MALEDHWNGLWMFSPPLNANPTRLNFRNLRTMPDMYAFQASKPTTESKTDSSTPKLTPNILPCRIHHDGPIESPARFWTPVTTDGKGTPHDSARGLMAMAGGLQHNLLLNHLFRAHSDSAFPRAPASRSPRCHPGGLSRYERTDN